MALRIYSLASALFIPGFLLAQPPPADQARQQQFAALHARVMSLQARHMVSVRGAETPDGLPRGAILQRVFQQLSDEAPTDVVAFTQFARDRFGATGPSIEVLRTALRSPENARRPLDICARVLDGSLPDGMSIAKYVTEVEEQADKEVEAHYQGIMDKFSPTVRATLLQTVASEAAATGSMTLDHMGAATEDADLYKTMMMATCRGKQSAPAPANREQPITTAIPLEQIQR